MLADPYSPMAPGDADAFSMDFTDWLAAGQPIFDHERDGQRVPGQRHRQQSAADNRRAGERLDVPGDYSVDVLPVLDHGQNGRGRTATRTAACRASDDGRGEEQRRPLDWNINLGHILQAAIVVIGLVSWAIASAGRAEQALLP